MAYEKEKLQPERSETSELERSNGNHQLDWQKYIEIAEKFQGKARHEDREDLKHTIILNLAVADRNNGHKPNNLSWAYRIASFTVAQYWRDYYLRTNGIDCGHCSNRQRKKCQSEHGYLNCARAIEVESLNKPIVDEDGHITELGDLLADDKAIDLDDWLDAKLWLFRAPVRLIEIAHKRLRGLPLTSAESLYLHKQRRNRLV